MKTQKYITAAAFAPLLLLSALTAPQITHAAIIAQYHFDEAGGTTAFDSAGSFNGTLTATGASFVPGGIAGNAISLDKALGGLVNMGTSFPGFLTGDFSIVLWVNTTTTLIDTVPLGKHAAGSENGYFIAINTTGGGGTANKATFVESEFVSLGTTSTTTVNNGAWHQIVGVYQAGGNESIYVDGSPAESTNAASAMVGNSAPFLIGGVNQSGTPNARYTGLVDEVQVYNQALTAAQIDFLFQNPTQVIPEPGTLSLFAFGIVGWLTLKRRSRNAS